MYLVYIEQAYTQRYASYTIDLHVNESCMCVAVRVLHSCAFGIVKMNHSKHYHIIHEVVVS